MFINGAMEVLGRNLTFDCNAANNRGGVIENSATDFLSLTNTCTLDIFPK